MTLNHTHHPAARSHVASANGHKDFPIQNLPYAMFAPKGQYPKVRAGVAIGDMVLDLPALMAANLLHGKDAAALEAACQGGGLNAFMATGPEVWRALRHALFTLLSADASTDVQKAVQTCFVAQAEVQYGLPVRVNNYTDFYTSIHHARNVGSIARPDNPLTPNFQWLPIAYHGRASSVVVSGTDFHRPMGQAMPAGAAAPVYGPCTRLDFELEMGFYVGAGNARGTQLKLETAEEHIFGMCLLNDWSARDHQFWEMAPLGPFLGKNFCTSVSPWIVTMEALAPFRTAAVQRPASEPQPLPYLDTAANRNSGGIDVQLCVELDTPQHRKDGKAPSQISRTTFAHQYWTVAQMLTQHTVGGCNMLPGDLVGTGTISGPTPEQAGAIVELSRGGSVTITLEQTGEQRTFLLDGDSIALRGWCEKPGAARIGFGSCTGTVLPAVAT